MDADEPTGVTQVARFQATPSRLAGTAAKGVRVCVEPRKRSRRPRNLRLVSVRDRRVRRNSFVDQRTSVAITIDRDGLRVGGISTYVLCRSRKRSRRIEQPGTITRKGNDRSSQGP